MQNTVLDAVFYVVSPLDNVATALSDVDAGTGELRGAKTGAITTEEHIPFGHKVALVDIARGEEIIKYRCPIGVALKDIKAGEYVHIHNVKSKLDERSNSFDAKTAKPQDVEYTLV
ncbi:hypothetical protein FACS1894110_00400 [Spirochaetia bacterium]|nr:hypothetical protein FACS1894110_00400 [Spirochaetia bacterium]